QRRRRDAARQGTGDAQVIGVDTVGNGGQERHAGTGLVGAIASALGDGLDLKRIRAVGHVQVVRFRRSEGKHRRMPALLADKSVRLFRQNALAHRSISSRYTTRYHVWSTGLAVLTMVIVRSR